MSVIQHSEETLTAFLGGGAVARPRGNADAALWKAILYYASNRRKRKADMPAIAKTCAHQMRRAIEEMGASPLVS